MLSKSNYNTETKSSNKDYSFVEFLLQHFYFTKANKSTRFFLPIFKKKQEVLISKFFILK